MLVQVALNGSRTRKDHPAVPMNPGEQAQEARAAVAAGAGAVHLHVRDRDGRESVASEDVAAALEALREASLGVPVGISTGAWIVRDVTRRQELIEAWEIVPDYASVNVHEEGAAALMRTLLERGVGIEAGIWDAASARVFLAGGLARECLRLLLEPAGGTGDVVANLVEIESVMARLERPRLLHGAGPSTWPMIELAARRGYDTRVGLEDTLTLPDGSVAPGNAALVAAALEVTSRSDRDAGGVRR